MDYVIRMDTTAWDLMWAYVDLMGSSEVGCFGYATIDPIREEIFVSEIFLVPQIADAGQVDFMDEGTGLVYAIEKAAAEGRLDEMKFCIHSHGDHAAAWSTTDEDMIKKMGLTTDWFASVIFNRKGASTGRVDVYDLPPLGKMQVSLKELDVVCARSTEYDNNCIDDLEKFVKKPPPKVITVPSKGGTTMVQWDSAEKALLNAMERQLAVDVKQLASACGWSCIMDNTVNCYYDKSNDEVWVETIDVGDKQEYILAVGSPNMDVVDGTIADEQLALASAAAHGYTEAAI